MWSNGQPDWCDSYGAIEIDGEWSVPFGSQEGAQEALEELQENTDVRLELVPGRIVGCWDIRAAR